MRIETGKYYKARDGRKVRIYATDGVDGFIHAAFLNGDGWIADSWCDDGHFRLSKIENNLDIIAEWSEPKLRPWSAEEVPIGALVRCKRVFFKGLITAAGLNNVTIGLDVYDRLVLLENWEHSRDGGKTWLPCGVEE